MLNMNLIFGALLIGIAVVIGSAALYTNVQNTKGPRERAFVKMNCMLLPLVLAGFFGLMYFLPSPWRYVVLVIGFVLMPMAIYRAATRRQIIRRLEELQTKGHEPMTG